MEVEAEVWYWSATGMKRIPKNVHQDGYIAKREAEILLDEAHRRGVEQGRSERNGE